MMHLQRMSAIRPYVLASDEQGAFEI